MAELFGAIQRGLGFTLNVFFEAVPSYGLAIILLTIASRLVLMPLTFKQMRSMRAMQKIGPQMKEIQKKYKGLQKKVNNRAELQELRMKQNQEVMGLYREHNASPAGGCLPMLAQFPVFIALFSIMRATVFMVALTATNLSGGSIPADEFTPEERAATICRPTSMTGESAEILCITDMPDVDPVENRYVISGVTETDRGGQPLEVSDVNIGLVARCNPILDVDESNTVFACASATGTGHLPRDGALFGAVNNDSATILGMHPGCTPNQARSDVGLRECTAEESDTGPLTVAPYFVLVLAIAATQYVAGKQMMARQGSQAQSQPMAQQAMMMTKIMPVFFGFISLSFPTGLNTYYLAFNFWQMGQQHFIIKRLEAEEAAGGGKAPPRKPGLMDKMRESMEKQQAQGKAAAETPPLEIEGDPSGIKDRAPGPKPHPRSKKKKKRKR